MLEACFFSQPQRKLDALDLAGCCCALRDLMHSVFEGGFLFRFFASVGGQPSAADCAKGCTLLTPEVMTGREVAASFFACMKKVHKTLATALGIPVTPGDYDPRY